MSSEHEWQDATFARRLLASAKTDERPARVQEAWARFAARLGSAVSDPGHDPVGTHDRAPTSSMPPGVRASAVGPVASWPHAVKWLLLGAVGGSALTAGFMSGRVHPKLDERAAESRATVSVPARPPTRAAQPPIPITEDKAWPSVARIAEQRSRKDSHGPRQPGGPSSARSARSTLADEVSRIDTARIAISSGDPDEAINLIERYHREFPDGALAHDADVVALEAAAAKGDRADVAQRARNFLSRYPNDPQAPRVSSLAESARER